jgi:hypothetical protein
MPFKLYYSPVVFYPLNDADIDFIIKDPVKVYDPNNGPIEDQLVLNSQGAEFINELLTVSPINWGQ